MFGTFCHYGTKRAVMSACFVTNEVVTNCAGIEPFFHVDISTSDIVCVCARACVRTSKTERQTEKKREKVREPERERE